MESTERPLIETGRRDHVIFAIVTVLYWVSLYTYIPILSPYLLEELHVGAALAGIILGTYGFMQILLRLPLGIWSDRLRRRRPFIALGLLTGGLSCLLFAVGDHPGWALAGRAMSGVCASTWVAFTVLYAAYHTRKDVQRAMSSISFLIVVGQLIGMGVSGWLADLYGSKATFYAGALAGAVGLFFVFGVKEPTGGVARSPMRFADIGTIVRNATLLRVSVLSILAHSVLFITMFGFTPSYATATLGATRWELSLLSFAFMVPHAFAQLYSGRLLAPRLGAWTTIAVGLAVSGLCTLAIPFAASLPALYATQALNGLAQGLHMPLFLALAIQGVQAEKQATAMGFYQSAYAAGMFGGPFAAGWINEIGGLNAGFWLGGVIGLASALVAVRFGAAARRAAEGRAG
ncbi:MFS transporter [Paenibacillus sp.]|uniref:MFS transporter n=1 Tax=Paenibacillus sp. TaxID=58172 RepID=UPI002D4FC61A|nr:MFS transporter [Paenibacillus sp.]HZG85728.1 MFS transporter [Paenibacillus sp.]